MTYVDAGALAARFFRQPETDAAVAIRPTRGDPFA
jgi:hypothetical protein